MALFEEHQRSGKVAAAAAVGAGGVRSWLPIPLGCVSLPSHPSIESKVDSNALIKTKMSYRNLEVSTYSWDEGVSRA